MALGPVGCQKQSKIIGQRKKKKKASTTAAYKGFKSSLAPFSFRRLPVPTLLLWVCITALLPP